MVIVGKEFGDVVQITDTKRPGIINLCVTPDGNVQKSVLVSFGQAELRQLRKALETFEISEDQL